MLAQVLWNSPRSLPLAVAAGVIAVAAVLWLYPPQVKELPWYWRWGLPAVRVAGMLALAVALLRPAIMRPKSGQERGAVLVLVDRSHSMAVSDNARSPADLVALADGLGHLPPGARPDVGGAIIARAADARPRLATVERAWGDLDYARVAGRGVEAARARVELATRELRQFLAQLERVAAALPDPAFRQRIGALGDIPSPDAADAGPKLAALRAALEATVAAASQVQAAADEQLYRSNGTVKAACDELASKTRFDLAADALLRPSGGLLSRLGRDTNVVGFGIAEDLEPLALRGTIPANPVDAVAGPPSTSPTTLPSTAPSFPGTADGRQSDIVGCVRKALDLFEGRDVAAVVLLSDGRPAGAPASVTASLGTSDTPVFAVAVAPRGGVRDASIARVVVPSSGFVGELATVRVDVRQQGMAGRDVQVRLATESAQGPDEQAQAVRLVDGRAATAEFRVKLTRVGAQRLSVSLAGTDGEATTENNTAVRWVKVLSQKVKVAAYAALPGWDFQYLRNTLARTPWVELRSAVLNPSAPHLPLSPEEILQQDVLVLSDVPLSALDDAQWGAAYRLASERGGSVVLLAGPAHVPAEYGTHFIASSLLPYPPDSPPTWRVWPGEEPMFRLVPDLQAAGEPVLRLAGESGAGLQQWHMLPGFYHVLPIGRLKPSAQALLVEASSAEPVLTQMRVGAGRAFLFGATETWRWRYGGGGEVHDRFWLQLIRHAAGEPYGARSERLALDVDRVAFELGQTVQAKVRALSGVAADALRLEVAQGGNTVRTLSLSLVGAAEAARFAARVGPLPAGEYELRLSEAGAAGALSLPLHVTAGYETELADVSGDESLLARLAESSGGELVPLEQVGRLAERLRDRTANRPRYVEQRLWDSPYLFVLVVACFAAEWAARKRLGLA